MKWRILIHVCSTAPGFRIWVCLSVFLCVYACAPICMCVCMYLYIYYMYIYYVCIHVNSVQGQGRNFQRQPSAATKCMYPFTQMSAQYLWYLYGMQCMHTRWKTQIKSLGQLQHAYVNISHHLHANDICIRVHKHTCPHSYTDIPIMIQDGKLKKKRFDSDGRPTRD